MVDPVPLTFQLVSSYRTIVTFTVIRSTVGGRGGENGIYDALPRLSNLGRFVFGGYDWDQFFLDSTDVNRGLFDQYQYRRLKSVS